MELRKTKRARNVRAPKKTNCIEPGEIALRPR
jgi:hypothetical protein